MNIATRARPLGAVQRREWTAEMIAPSVDAGQGTRQSFVAAPFTLPAGSRPMLFISALGLYRAFVNGRRVGNDLLTPGWTCYDDRIAYQSYDISDLVHEGENRIEIWLGDGWYRSQMMWRHQMIVNCWGDRIAAIAEIVDRDALVLKSDGNWTSGLLPITRSGIYYGEDYDARLERLEDTGSVSLVGFETAKLVAHEAPPVRELEPLRPVEAWDDAEGRHIYDFGQNAGGYVRFTVRGAAGARLYVDHAEVLGPEKAFDNRNYRSARAALGYTLKGEGDEVYAPVFTFTGFRYARVAIEGEAEVLSIELVPISSIPQATGGFTCGDETVNRLVLNTLWSQRANFIEIPTDCPQRDERLGWTGDAQVFAGTACWLGDCQAFLKKYLRDVMHDQRDNGAVPHFSPDPTRLHPEAVEGDWAGSTGWGDAIVTIPWQLYLHYGDRAALEECFPAMLRWLDYLWSISDGPIIRPNSVWGSDGFTFGDWLQPVGDNRKPRPTIGDDCAATLYHFISTELAATIAGILGNDAEQKRLEARAADIRGAFAREYFSATGRLAHNDQTSYALAFLHDLVPAEHFEAAKAYFRKVIEDADYLIGTGFIGTPALLPALTRLGMDDVAEKVFLNRKVPGWLYQVEQGATTIWERWDALGPDGTIYDPEMNSYNHYAYGAVCQWLFEDVAGVRPLASAPGFARVMLEPSILPALGHVSMWHETGHGRIEAGWGIEDGRVSYVVTLPEGIEAIWPAAGQANLEIDGKPADGRQEEIVLRSGRHEIGFDIRGE
ncbi:alpha-L-rhamnosidase [Martelella endophytica]|uniref:alpha-L-rhamnosidase n=1 Tax=Martelella endophytica TaxID=1486262 RepID=A0A0D5LWE8_MAREN|nr:alpha-L-rhamnosidase [Martelella endophytica]AJY47748.1 alpha-L-rhamnosidase [Martelella endophytica]